MAKQFSVPHSMVTLQTLFSLVEKTLQMSDTPPLIHSVIVPGNIMSGDDAVLQCNYQYYTVPYSVRSRYGRDMLIRE